MIAECPYCLSVERLTDYADPKIEGYKIYRYLKCPNCGNFMIMESMIEHYTIEKV